LKRLREGRFYPVSYLPPRKEQPVEIKELAANENFMALKKAYAVSIQPDRRRKCLLNKE